MVHIGDPGLDEILGSPYVLVGMMDQLVEGLQSRRERWGISYYTVQEPFMDALAPVVARRGIPPAPDVPCGFFHPTNVL